MHALAILIVERRDSNFQHATPNCAVEQHVTLWTRDFRRPIRRTAQVVGCWTHWAEVTVDRIKEFKLWLVVTTDEGAAQVRLECDEHCERVVDTTCRAFSMTWPQWYWLWTSWMSYWSCKNLSVATIPCVQIYTLQSCIVSYAHDVRTGCI